MREAGDLVCKHTAHSQFAMDVCALLCCVWSDDWDPGLEFVGKKVLEGIKGKDSRISNVE